MEYSLPKGPRQRGVLAGADSITADDRNRIKRLLKKAGSIIGITPNSLEAIMEIGTRVKLDAIS